MNIVLSFEDMIPHIEVALPDEDAIFDVLALIKRAYDEGKRQVIHIGFESGMVMPVPRHGKIEFNLRGGSLYVEAEGPWWLYENRSRLEASKIALQMICEVAHVHLTVKSTVKT